MSYVVAIVLTKPEYMLILHFQNQVEESENRKSQMRKCGLSYIDYNCSKVIRKVCKTNCFATEAPPSSEIYFRNFDDKWKTRSSSSRVHLLHQPLSPEAPEEEDVDTRSKELSALPR